MQQTLPQEYQLLDLSMEDLDREARECSLILYCDDHWQVQTQHRLNRACLTLGLPWLRAYCEFGVAIIGPCVFPNETGCITCVETRRRVVWNATDFIVFTEQPEEEQRRREQPWLTSSSLEILAQLVAQEVCACLKMPDTLQTHRALLYLELDTLQSYRHSFLPEPECPACGSLPQDTPLAATITLQARPKLSPSTYRIRSLAAHASALFETYVDTETGPVSLLVKDTNETIAMVTAWIGIRSGESQTQMSGTGRTLSYRQSKLAAIAEALERYGGQCPKGKRTMVEASYRQLGEQALDPTTLGLHRREQYALPGYRYVPYHHDLVCHWVWGYSFGRKRPILVPQHYAYYGLLRFFPQEDARSSFVYEISNGCALGNCLEEAIFYGILEVAERDAFLMTWYAQLSLPRLDPLSATNPLVGLVLENLEHSSGYKISVFNSTLDHGVPCCWVMAVDEQDRPGMPKALCAAGSHPHPEQAVLSALLELDSMVKSPHEEFQTGRERALEMLADPMAVKEMADHSFLYSLPEAFERLSFLHHSPQRQHTFQEAFGAFYQGTPGMDLRDDLSAFIEHYLARGIDIIVVDQTGPDHAAQNFHCVKVIMPGMMPMTFGHQYRRTSGFQRLSALPVQLGYRDQPLTDAEINPDPHPFP